MQIYTVNGDWGGTVFISFSHLLPKAICGVPVACRNIITALMHVLKCSSSSNFTSSALQDCN